MSNQNKKQNRIREVEKKMRPELLEGFKKAQQRYDQAFRNLKDR